MTYRRERIQLSKLVARLKLEIQFLAQYSNIGIFPLGSRGCLNFPLLMFATVLNSE